MGSSGARTIKLSVNLKPFISRVSRNGAVQKAFAEEIGRPVGGCVASGVHTGMSSSAIHKVARDCAKSVRGKRLNVNAYRVGGRARSRVAAESYEAFEVS